MHHFGSVVACRLGDRVIVGADDHPRDRSTALGCLNAATDQRNPSDLLKVFAGDSLGYAAGRDQGQCRFGRLLHWDWALRSVRIRWDPSYSLLR